MFSLETLTKIKAVVGSSLMIMGSVSAGFTLAMNYLIDDQQIRAQHMGNHLAFTQVVKQKSKLINDPGDVKNVDLRSLLEVCGSKDFNRFYLAYVSQYDQNEFDNSCSLIKSELSNRSTMSF